LPALPAIGGHLADGVGHMRHDCVEGARDSAQDRKIAYDVVDVPDTAGQVTTTGGHGGADAVKQLTAQVS